MTFMQNAPDPVAPGVQGAWHAAEATAPYNQALLSRAPPPLGATHEDWVHLDLMLGLTADLLPVVSDPNARISPNSTMKALGKTPSYFNRDGDAIGFPKWTEHRASSRDLERWSSNDRLGICIQTRRVRALDIDVADRALSDAIHAFVDDHLDVVLPERHRSNSGKRLLAFIVDGDMPKRRMTVDGGVIEFLATGQQFVAVGTHPSGVRYRWRRGLPNDIPSITVEQFDALWSSMVERFAVEAPTAGTGPRRSGENLYLDDPVVDYLLTKWETHGQGRDGQVYATCPWAEDHTQDSGPTASSWIPAGTRGYQLGHYSCLHAHCSGRTDHDFLTAVGYTTDGFEDLGPMPEPERAPSTALAKPWRYVDPATLPPRRWLYGRHYIRRFVSATVAPGGSGKSALALTEAMSIASGRPLLRVTPAERTRVWYFNGEDPLEETERRIAAACIQYGVSADELEGRLFLGSGRDTELVLADQKREGVVLRLPVVDEVIRLVRHHEIGLVMVDPFVSSHRVSENDNGAIDTVVKKWGFIAEATGCAVELVHHVRKGQAGVETTVEDARGASALISGARAARVLNRMTDKEGERAGVRNPHAYFRVTNGKANLAPPSDQSEWYRFLSVELGNGDNVGVIQSWEWPQEMAAVVSVDDIAAVQALLTERAEYCRYDARSTEWFGKLVAEVLDCDLGDQEAKKYIKGLIDDWIAGGFFVPVDRPDNRRKMKPCVAVGSAPLLRTGAD